MVVKKKVQEKKEQSTFIKLSFSGDDNVDIEKKMIVMEVGCGINEEKLLANLIFLLGNPSLKQTIIQSVQTNFGKECVDNVLAHLFHLETLAQEIKSNIDNVPVVRPIHVFGKENANNRP